MMTLDDAKRMIKWAYAWIIDLDSKKPGDFYGSLLPLTDQFIRLDLRNAIDALNRYKWPGYEEMVIEIQGLQKILGEKLQQHWDISFPGTRLINAVN